MKHKPVLVYQMGKVGSRTTYFSIKDYCLALDVHNFDNKSRDPLPIIDQLKVKEEFKLHVKKQNELYLKVKQALKNKERGWKVITLICERIGRNISAFFENIAVPAHSCFVGDAEYVKNIPIHELINIYFERASIPYNRRNKYLDHGWVNDDYIDSWFDNNLKKWFHIDVYAEDFDKSNGWKIYKNKLAEILLIRLENLNRTGIKAICNFLNIRDKNFVLKNKNVGREKWYADIYEEFKQKIVFREDYLDKVYGSKFMKHFYSDDEINNFRQIWLRSKVQKNVA